MRDQVATIQGFLTRRELLGEMVMGMVLGESCYK